MSLEAVLRANPDAGRAPVGRWLGAGRAPVVRIAMIKMIASCNNLNNHTGGLQVTYSSKD